jgi:succinate dehydrogenase / fumarate reductase membrane anchor subunit
MATATDPRPAAPAPSSGARNLDYGAGRIRPTGGFEFWSWVFMRISAIVLLFLAVGHVLIMHIPAGGVSRVDFAFVAVRWQSPFWRTWDWMMLTLALIHGINGLRVITLDYVRKPGWRVGLNFAYAIIGFTLFILGTVVVVTFDPTRFLQ